MKLDEDNDWLDPANDPFFDTVGVDELEIGLYESPHCDPHGEAQAQFGGVIKWSPGKAR